jgi:hypothetical protein
LTDLTACPHPVVLLALHAPALITTMPPPNVATQSVPVAGSSASAVGEPEILIVAIGFAQPLVTDTLHLAPLTTVTLSAPGRPLPTYSVLVLGSSGP